MTDPIRTPKPEHGPEEPDPTESTSVRPRPSFVQPPPSSTPPGRVKSGEWPAFASLSDPNELVRRAKVILAELPANHPRAQILRTAIVRRDEIVLVRLIEELRSAR